MKTVRRPPFIILSCHDSVFSFRLLTPARKAE